MVLVRGRKVVVGSSCDAHQAAQLIRSTPADRSCCSAVASSPLRRVSAPTTSPLSSAGAVEAAGAFAGSEASALLLLPGSFDLRALSMTVILMMIVDLLSCFHRSS